MVERLPDYQVENLAGWYLELLGGGTEGFVNGLKDDVVYSLGTVYAGDEITKDNLEFKYEHTIEDIQSFYYITDVYGNDYNLTATNLGLAKGQGLDNYMPEFDNPEKYDNSFDRSQLVADGIRKDAAEKAKEQQEAEQNAQDQETGDQEAGNQEAGNQEAGDQEAGDQEAGDQEAGDQETGDQEAGDQESGDQNTNDNNRTKLSDEAVTRSIEPETAVVTPAPSAIEEEAVNEASVNEAAVN